MKLSLLLIILSFLTDTKDHNRSSSFDLIEYENVYTFLMDKEAFQSSKANLVLKNQKGEKLFSRKLRRKNQVVQFDFSQLQSGQYWFYIKYGDTVDWRSINIQ